ncbi:LOB domain-containing protein 39 [Prunus yedoensis var. nudiflora]|uniref:LOB domain-containing protein 39 n=1 Tax=Prunus yedoensis var. nudiflora TaxID=2094558 RepID=A0A314YVK8_PRUYE|nr:LOB domain-containing protein 39 [Prunus yedoensis var. nudiflora]
MSCNGCRVLRKGCSETCILRSCLQAIDSPEAQGNATLFLAKFFGRSDLLSFISAVPESQRPALFQSLLFEACGRTINPVNGAVGLLSSGNWHVCQSAVETVLSGGVLRPLTAVLTPSLHESSETSSRGACTLQNLYYPSVPSAYYDTERSQPFDAGLSLKPNLAAGERGMRSSSCVSTAVEKRPRYTVSFSSEESVMTSTTSFERGGGLKDRKVLNLFV